MNRNDAGQRAPSLIERAAKVYDFNAALRAPSSGPAVGVEPAPGPPPAVDADPLPAVEVALAVAPEREPRSDTGSASRFVVDRSALSSAGYLDPAAPPTATSEEFRIVKRRILANALGDGAQPRDRLVLINSPHAGDGKTWVALNLALSLAAEKELDVLLVDADFGKPGVCQTLGISPVPGLMDALVDHSIDAADLIVPTDLPSLSILPAGRSVHNDTELLASSRTQTVLNALVASHPRRIVLLDSPPALAASAASELARHVGEVLMVVRADRTTEAALRDAVQLLSACPRMEAILNGVKFSSSGRRFGAYYGKSG